MLTPRIEAALRKIGWRPEVEMAQEVLDYVESGWTHEELAHMLREKLKNGQR